MTASKIILSEKEPFAHGRYRRCYVHPENPTWCIKINHPDFRPENVQQRARIWKRLRSARAFDQTRREIAHYQRYIRNYGDEIWTHVPRYRGTVDTDLGIGLVVDMIKTREGLPAPRISKLLRGGGCFELERSLDVFRQFLRRHRLLTHELRLQNLVLGRSPDELTVRVYIVDAIGLPDWIPLAYYWQWLAERRVESKIRRLNARIKRLKKGESGH